MNWNESATRTRDGRVRILYVIDALAPGGTEKQLIELVRGLDSRRFDPRLCTLRPSAMDLTSVGCPILELDVGSFASRSAVQGLRRLRRYLRGERIDLVQTFFQDSTVLAALARIGTGVPVCVASFRDLGFWRTPGKVWQLRAVYPLFDRFIANSPAVAEQVAQADGLAIERIEVIPNGVRVPPRAAALTAGSVVGIVANLNRPVKRVDLFLETASLVRQAVPGARFVIIGEGHLRSSLVAQAARLGLADVVGFAGLVADVPHEILSFDVGVLSSDSEGLSNAILEYMAAGVPVVCRRVGGNVDLVRPGETGFVVSSDDPAALAEPIVRLLVDREARRRLGAEGRRIAVTRFGLEACIRQHEALYERLLAARRRDTRDDSLERVEEGQA
jgi:glycosyltransferase involved in cell wall biosynthesis